MVAKKDIVRALEELGLRKGDIVFAHASLSSFGSVERGADTVIDALMTLTTQEGGVLMPSFPAFGRGGEYGLVIDNDIVFDLRTSPSAMGRISDVFWKREGVTRSIHPTHPVAAWGKRAKSIIEGHQECLCSCGEGTPFHKNCLEGGTILLVGVTHACNTTLHTVEDINGAPTRTVSIFHPKVIDGDGRKITVPTRPHLPGIPRCFPVMEELCREKGIQTQVKVGNSLLKLIRADKMLEIGTERINKDPLFLIDMERMQ